MNKGASLTVSALSSPFFDFFVLSFLFSSTLLRSLSRVVLLVLLNSAPTTTARFVIFQSASVRTKHLIDPYFDQDYLFELPLQGAGCPITRAVFYFPPCRFSSCPAYEPNSNEGE